MDGEFPLGTSLPMGLGMLILAKLRPSESEGGLVALSEFGERVRFLTLEDDGEIGVEILL